MRCTQIHGLTEEAEEFISKHAQKESFTCPVCGEGTITKPLVVKRNNKAHLGMFQDGPILSTYIDKDGSAISEVVQEVVWSSGPCIFLCLKYKDELIHSWPQKTINEC